MIFDLLSVILWPFLRPNWYGFGCTREKQFARRVPHLSGLVCSHPSCGQCRNIGR